MDMGLMALTGLTVAQRFGAAKDARAEGKVAAEMEGVAALQRETDRKLELMKAISSQRARSGASGIDISAGSPLSVISQQLEEEERDTQRDKFNTQIAQQSAKYRAQLKAGQLRGRAQKSLLAMGFGADERKFAKDLEKPGSIK